MFVAYFSLSDYIDALVMERIGEVFMQDDIEIAGDGAAKSLVTSVVLTAEGRRNRIYVTRLQVESASLVAATRFQDLYDAARTRLDEAMRLVELSLTGTIEITLRKGVLLEAGLLDTLGRIEAEQHLWHLQQTAGWSSRALVTRT